MAIPRVFISSTCYDLKYIRENLKYFVRSLGYEPVLSDEGDVFYNPGLHTHDACISEVTSCQIFVLIIGGRYGGIHKDGEKSITNREYEEAVRLKVPVFALVDSSVYSEHHVYVENRKKHAPLTPPKIHYPSTDDERVFGFIDQVRKQVVNNAIVPFNDFSDIEGYLRKQWAGMLYNYITSESEAARVGVLFESISDATSKIEFMTKQLAMNTNDKTTRLNIEFYELIAGSGVAHDCTYWGFNIKPKDFLLYENIDDYCNDEIEVDDDPDAGNSIGLGGPPYRCSKIRHDQLANEYEKLRNTIIGRLEEESIDVKDFLAGISTT